MVIVKSEWLNLRSLITATAALPELEYLHHQPSARMRSEGYSSCFVILSVCVCLLLRFLPLRATRRSIGDTNGFSATLALFLT